MRAVNPATDELIEEYPEHSPEEVDEKVDAAVEAYEAWRETDFSRRADVMERAAEVLRDDQERYARLMTREMGKPIEEARGEVEKCAWVCEYFAEQAAGFLEPTEIETDASSSYVRYEPLGPILAIMPWNFPFWQVFRFAAPNLMAGNVGLLKHAANVPGCARAIEEVFREAGLPEGAFQSLLIGREPAQTLIEGDRVRGVTLTGSVRAGRAVASAAAEQIKPTVLELGGSDPFIVLPGADLERTVEQAVRARTINNGQSCIAAKRFIVDENVYNQFLEAFRQRLDELKLGDPLDETTDIGPMARPDLRETLHEQVTESLEMGARCELGGEIPVGDGYFYPPTILVDLEDGMPAWSDETFGPVAAVVRASGADEAVRLASDSDYGLGASVWGRTSQAKPLVDDIEAGHVAVNGIVKSDPRLPFGGIKDSGYGRELARDGILEFVNKKTVWVR